MWESDRAEQNSTVAEPNARPRGSVLATKKVGNLQLEALKVRMSSAPRSNHDHNHSSFHDLGYIEPASGSQRLFRFLVQPYRDMGLWSKKDKQKKRASGKGSQLYDTSTSDGVLDIEVAQVISALQERNLHYDPVRAKALLEGRFSAGDATRAFNLALALRDAEDLILIEPTKQHLQGAENLRGTTCYLDALLFAMFSRHLPLFDTLLYHQGTSIVANKLAVDLRLFVNLLRSGYLVTSDIVDMLRESIARCGWEEARGNAQQDTSECFGFVADMLGMPNLTFNVHIAHGGRADSEADYKVIQERFLALSIPEPPKGLRTGTSLEPIELVDLIDQNFHNKLEVKRHLGRSRSTIVDLSLAVTSVLSPQMDEQGSNSQLPPVYSSGRYGYTSEKKERGEITMQAWQLFELLPRYVPTDSSPRQIDLAKQPVVVAICLKRYYFDDHQRAVLNPTSVLIPEFIDLTRYTENDPGSQNRLRLESAVCHRGQHVGSGHYVAISRGHTLGQWLLFDDLATQRVTQASFQYMFAQETPYLLFYQLETLHPRPAPSRRAPSVPNFGYIAPEEVTPDNAIPFAAYAAGPR